MKKYIFLFSILSVILSSCSSDNDPISQNTDQDPIKYKVNLNITSLGFEVDKVPLKSTYPNSASFLQVIIYNESGTVYSDTIVEETALSAENNTSSMRLELPKGNYYISVFNRIYDSYTSKLEDVVIIPNDYETDYYDRRTGNTTSSYSNTNMYYYTETLNITEDNNTSKKHYP